MRLLLDTHIALWLIADSPRLPRGTRIQVEAAMTISVSAITILEIAIKHMRRRGRPDDIELSGREAHDRFVEAGFAPLSIIADHATALDDLPLLHGDPFDRLLIAQARVEGMQLLTHDAALAAYGQPVNLI